MAALGKIRSKGAILIAVIGFALFAFIAEELVRSTESMRNDSRQQIGEILGEKVNVQDFQALVDEYQDVIKLTQGRDNLTEEELNQVKDQVWSTYIQTKVIEKEVKELGLTVTDQELQNILKEGTNPMLAQTPFVNQQTGRFDANALKKFLADYKQAKTSNPQALQQYETSYKYWQFIEKTLRQQVLAQKYQVLLASSLISNKVSAKQAFKDQNEEASIQLAAFPYTEVKETEAKVSDADLKAKYEELKPAFRQYQESRDIKYVSVKVTASAADRQTTMKSVTEAAQQLQTAEDPTEVVRKSGSMLQYLGIPVSKNAFPQDIAQRLDSMAVGSTYGPVENKQDNTLNVIRLISKQQMPDSIQFRVIQVGAETIDLARTKADSIYNALKGGADFETLAKAYGQTGEKTWLTTQQYEQAPSVDKDTRTYLTTLNTLAAGETANLQLTSANIILQVVDRKAFNDKYVAAVIKRSIDFTKDTYSQAYNKFSAFVSKVSDSKDIKEFEAEAKKAGYQVQELNDQTTSQHNIAGIRATREALKWLFEAKKGAVSPLYECGNNDNLLVCCLTNIHEEGYRSLDDEQVKTFVRAEALRDKQAEVIMKKIQGVNSVAAAKAKGGKVSDIQQVTFASPVFIPATGAAEPALSGAVAATKAGAFSAHPVKGYSGVYVFKVNKKANRPVKYDENITLQQLRQRNLQMAGNFMQELMQNAKVKDNRYLFF